MPARSTLPTNITGSSTGHLTHANSLHTFYNVASGIPLPLVAATNATQAVKDRAAYTCDGTADEVEINAALALGAGGVQLSAGTFTTAATINVTVNQRIIGAGIDNTLIIGSANTYHVIHMGNRQADGIMRNFMALRDLSVSSVGGANNFDTVWCDGFGNGSHLMNVKASEGKYAIRITDADQCCFYNIKCFNARTASLYCEVGLENTWGNVAFYSPSTVASDASTPAWLFGANANQATPNRFDRVSVYGGLIYANTGLAGSVGLKMTVGATAFPWVGTLFENPLTHVQLDDETQMTLLGCSFIQNSGVSTDIFKFSNDPSTVTLTDCRLQQATNAFNAVSGSPHICLLGRNTNQGNITNLFVGSFGSKQGTDTVFAGNGVMASGLDNQRYDYGFFNNLLANTSLRVAYSTTATTPGSVVRKIQVFDASGASLGYIPVYSTIT